MEFTVLSCMAAGSSDVPSSIRRTDLLLMMHPMSLFSRHRPSSIRVGLSLVEMMVAMTVMVTLTVIVLQSLVAAQRWRSLAAAEDEINAAAADVFNVMSVDLAESGWWFPDPTPLPNALLADRGARYFPYVQIQGIGTLTQSQGGQFFGYWRPEPSVRLFPGPGNNGREAIIERLPGNVDDVGAVFGADRAGYLASFFARSQELIFLKQTSSGWQPNPTMRPLPTMVFPDGDWSSATATDYGAVGIANRAALGVLMPSGWEEIAPTVFQHRPYDANGDGVVGPTEGLDGSGSQLEPYGVPITTAKLNAAAGITLLNNWETMAVPDFNGASPQQAFREYGYVVVPSPLSLGRLVRVYSMTNADAGGLAVGTDPGQRLPQAVGGAPYQLVVDRVLAEHVVRLVCDTFRTDDNLLINEVRARVYLAREVPGDNMFVVNRIVESILIMRAKAAAAIDAADTIQANGNIDLAY